MPMFIPVLLNKTAQLAAAGDAIPPCVPDSCVEGLNCTTPPNATSCMTCIVGKYWVRAHEVTLELEVAEVPFLDTSA
jgi:hypothetical protein